ncbi:MAG: hypothetical protein PHG00_13325 [Methylococcales bacterium]|nr:hypothetical protein [Methylococcales bacterium]
MNNCTITQCHLYQHRPKKALHPVKENAQSSSSPINYEFSQEIAPESAFLTPNEHLSGQLEARA